MGVDFADYNNDGFPDLVITDLANQMYALYRDNGDGTFTYETYPSGLGRMTATHSGWGVRFLDCDLDGWKDLLIAQGHDLDTIQLTFPICVTANRCCWPETPEKNSSTSRQLPATYSNKHGSDEVWRLEILTMMAAWMRLSPPMTVPPTFSAMKPPTHNHWLILRLRGHTSNRDAIGAVVKVVTPQGPQFATVTTAGSYLSSSDKRLHFGLGLETSVKSIEIRWPSGILQTLPNVRGDQIVQIDESPATVSGGSVKR